MKAFILTLVSCLMLIPLNLCAHGLNSPWYIRGIGGVGVADRQEIKMVQTKLHKTGFVFAGAIGYETCYNFRIEGEIAYRRHSIKQLNVHIQGLSFCQPACGHFGSLAFMANILYDLPFDFCFYPYAGVGVGGALNKFHLKINPLGEVVRTSHHRNGFAWQFIAGVAFPFWECLDLNVEYRYYKPHVRHFHENDAALGLRYYF